MVFQPSQSMMWYVLVRVPLFRRPSCLRIAAADALHVATAAVAGVQYLLTLDCRHIANAHELPRIDRLLEDLGYGQMLICTPAEFLGGDDDDDEESDC